jgi:hypothetical protein
VAGLEPLIGLAELVEEDGPASAFRDKSAIVAILDPADGVDLTLEELGGVDFGPPF